MLNIELARIVAAERLRETEENVRQGRFRRAYHAQGLARAGCGDSAFQNRGRRAGRAGG